MKQYVRRDSFSPEKCISILNHGTNVLKGIEKKLNDDHLINEGMFILATSYFEDTLRQIMTEVLISFPDKLENASITIDRKDLRNINKNGIGIIIDNELYAFFKSGITAMLRNIFEITNGKNENTSNYEIDELIRKSSDIFLYRNNLVHSGGVPNEKFCNALRIYKCSDKSHIEYSSNLVNDFINVLNNVYESIGNGISITFSKFFLKRSSVIDSYPKGSRLAILEKTWYEVFDSSLLKFDDYWDISGENDLIIGVKFPSFECNLSSSEEILLSIWRHQYYDALSTKEYLLCSINTEDIFISLQALKDTEFYYMFQEADRLGLVDRIWIKEYFLRHK